MTTVHYLDVATINTGGRQRKKFTAQSLDKLAQSIMSDAGLLHPIVVRSLVNDTYQLVAGGRRLRAILQLYIDENTFYFAGLLVPKNTIPAIIASDTLTDADIFEAELAENIHREDLTWQERVSAIAELHALRKSQNPDHTYADTARELRPSKQTDNPEHTGTSPMRPANSVLVAEHLDDEDVANAPSERDALRIITRKIEQQFKRATPAVETRHTLHLGDFREVSLSPLKYDTVITDPPYSIGVSQFGDAAKLSHEYTEVDTKFLLEELVIKLTKSCVLGAHAFVFCDIKLFTFLKLIFEHHKWTVRRTPLIWSKGNRGHLSEGDVYGFRRSYELILVAHRGNKSYKSLMNDIIHVEADTNKVHAAQKPIELYTRLLQITTYEGEHVFDPFAGSGPIFGAAKATGTIATGCEINEKFIEHIEGTYDVRRT